MKQRMSSEFIYQLFALLIAVIVVHAVYVGAIRPSADAHIKKEMELQASGVDFVPERGFTVVIRDYEQESCFILLIWALAIMGYKGRRAMHEQGLLDRRLLEIPEGTTLLPAGRPGVQPLAGSTAGAGAGLPVAAHLAVGAAAFRHHRQHSGSVRHYQGKL